MLLRLPPTLHYPITVTELSKQPNDNVERFAPLFSYSYTTKVTEGDNLGNEEQVSKSFPARFQSDVEGTLSRWCIKAGTVISHPDVLIAEISELCAHSVQFGGMCVNCGKDMTESTYNTDQPDSSRATINMVHDNVSLTISKDEAERADDEAKRRLLASNRLSLVVDLDQTIIHATVDPTVGDWQRNEDNPNHDAVKGVRAFLLDDDAPGKPGCWYYIKLRPGLEDFLTNVSKLYELHIYTMGTRAYAKNIADIIDPEHKIFGDRILSRTESGSMTAKNLQRLFPVDTKMVVIIDDRADVWKWSPNLIKVTPYDFFVGIGDINSSFLPKKPGPRPSPKATTIATSIPNGHVSKSTTVEADHNTNGTVVKEALAPLAEDAVNPVSTNVSPLERLVEMGGNGDLITHEAQTSSQKETIDKQVKEQPLLQKQKQLEAEDAAADTAAAAAAAKEDGETVSTSPASDEIVELERPKHNLLQDNDRELYQLENSLRSVHTEFFNIYNSNKKLPATSGGRVGQLRGAQKRKAPSDSLDLDLVPDISIVLPSVKAKVLAGVVIVFSGVIPLGMDVGSTDIGILAQSFGARIEEKISRHTTHLVAAKNRTSKVDVAKKQHGRITIVTPQWLTDSVASWARKDEGQYLLDPSEEAKNLHYEDANDDEILSESEDPVADEDETDNDISRDRLKPGLTIDTNPPSSEAGETEPDIDFDKLEGSPVGGTNDDWANMNKEAEEFFGDLGSDSEDGEDYGPYDDDRDENDDVSDDSAATSKASVRGKKRGRDEVESGTESEGDSSGKVKKRQALGNGLTSLSQTTNADASDDETPVNGVDTATTDLKGDTNGIESENPAAKAEEEEEDDGWGDEQEREFERELEEEMRKAQSEEELREG